MLLDQAYFFTLAMDRVSWSAFSSTNRGWRAELMCVAFFANLLVATPKLVHQCAKEGLLDEIEPPAPPLHKLHKPSKKRRSVSISAPKPHQLLPDELLMVIFDKVLEDYDNLRRRQHVRLQQIGLINRRFRRWALHLDTERCAIQARTAPPIFDPAVRELDVTCDLSSSAGNLFCLVSQSAKLSNLQALKLRIKSKKSRTARLQHPFDMYTHRMLLDEDFPRRTIFLPNLVSLDVDICAATSKYWLHSVLYECRALKHLTLNRLQTRQELSPWTMADPPEFALTRFVRWQSEGDCSEGLLNWIVSSSSGGSLHVCTSEAMWPCVDIDTISAASIRELDCLWLFWAASHPWQSLPNLEVLRLFEVVLPSVQLAQVSLGPANLPSLKKLCLGICVKGLRAVRKVFPPYVTQNNLIELVEFLGITELEMDDERRVWKRDQKAKLILACMRSGIELSWHPLGNSLSKQFASCVW